MNNYGRTTTGVSVRFTNRQRANELRRTLDFLDSENKRLKDEVNAMRDIEHFRAEIARLTLENDRLRRELCGEVPA